MHGRNIRLIAVPLVVCGLVLVIATGASAAITSTHITSPTDPSYFEQEATGAAAEMTVSGTVESTGKPGTIEIRCYADPETSEEVAEVEEQEEPGEEEGLVKTGPGKYSFSVKVAVEEAGESPCILRAVPEATTGILAPGAASKFEGPRIAFSEVSAQSDQTDDTTVAYEVEERTLSTVFEIDNAGLCGLSESELLSSPGLAPGAELFQCAGALYGRSAGATRSDIQVDGRNAYDPYAADSIYTSLKPGGKAPETEFETKFEPQTGLTTIHEIEPLVECSGKTVAYPETKESCEEFVGAGVSLERTWTPSHAGRLIGMSDVWRSTDGAEHAVSIRYDQELGSDLTSPGTYQFPGGAQSFASTTSGETVQLPGDDGAILYREDGTAAEAVGSSHPVGAIIFQTPPSEDVLASAGSGDTKGSSALVMPYQLTIPASGTQTVSMAYAEGYTLAEVCALAEAAGSGCQPSLAISSPAAGEQTVSKSVTVSGSASDAIALNSLTVDGKSVTVTGGAWSTALMLQPGPNTITAIATNRAGLTRTAAINVTAPSAEEEEKAKAKAEEVAGAKAHEEAAAKAKAEQEAAATVAKNRAGEEAAAAAKRKAEEAAAGPVAKIAAAARIVKGAVTITVDCAGTTGTCSIKVVLTTVEKLKAGRPHALAASTRTVTLGSVTVSTPAGSTRTITLKLNATGRSLLARFHRLPVHLAVSQRGVSGRGSSIAAQNLAIIARGR